MTRTLTALIASTALVATLSAPVPAAARGNSGALFAGAVIGLAAGAIAGAVIAENDHPHPVQPYYGNPRVQYVEPDYAPQGYYVAPGYYRDHDYDRDHWRHHEYRYRYWQNYPQPQFQHDPNR